MERNTAACALCKLETEVELHAVREGGLETLLKYCKRRHDSELAEHLNFLKANGFPIYVHNPCRKVFTDPRKVSNAHNNSSASSDSASRITRSKVSKFDWKQNCLFCGEECPADEKHPDRDEKTVKQSLFPRNP